MSRLYADENVALPLVTRLRELGHDVLTAFEAGAANLRVPDEAVLAYARSEERLLLTNNRRDFIALHRGGSPHCGVVVFTFDTNWDSLASRIDSALEAVVELPRPLVRVTRTTFSIV